MISSGDVQRGGVRGLLGSLHDLRHEALLILIGSAVARYVNALDRVTVLQTLHVFVDVDARTFAFVEAKSVAPSTHLMPADQISV
ncbi:MAG: hypothetical protein R2881_11075 [Eubacteriales bacterium]